MPLDASSLAHRWAHTASDPTELRLQALGLARGAIPMQLRRALPRVSAAPLTVEDSLVLLLPLLDEGLFAVDGP